MVLLTHRISLSISKSIFSLFWVGGFVLEIHFFTSYILFLERWRGFMKGLYVMQIINRESTRVHSIQALPN